MPVSSGRYVVGLALLVTIEGCGGGCGKGGGGGLSGAAIEAPKGIDPEHAKVVGGTTGLPTILTDLATIRDAFRAQLTKDKPDLQKDPSDSHPFASMASTDAWIAAGLDPKAELTWFTDDRFGWETDDGMVPLPITLLKVDARDKMVEKAKSLGGEFTFGTKQGNIEELVSNGETVGLVGSLGDLSAFAPRGRMKDSMPAAFEKALSGGGALADFPAWKAAMKGGPGGAGVYLWLRDMSQFELIGDVLDMRRRDRRGLAAAMGQSVTAVGLRIGQEGLAFRMVPNDNLKEPIAKLLAGNASPSDVGKLVPPRGWAVGRLSIDLADGVGSILKAYGQSPDLPRAALGQAGLSWDDVIAAFTGDFALAFDVASALAGLAKEGDPKAFYAVGLRDRQKAQELVEKLLARLADLNIKESTATFGGESGYRLQIGGQTFAIVLLSDLLIAATDEDTMNAALARRGGENLAASPEGEVLRERLAFAAVADVGPFMALIDSEVTGPIKYLGLLPFALRGPMALSTWKAFSERPLVTVRMGFDGDAQFLAIRDAGWAYGTLLGLGAVALLPDGFSSKGRGSSAACDKLMAKIEECAAAAPEETRQSLREAVKAMSTSKPDAAMCEQMYTGVADGMKTTCPKVVW